jgi:hypothetical protein
VTEPHEKLTTDPPRPPGTPDVDDLVGDPVPGTASEAERDQPAHEDPAAEDLASDTVSVEPPD